MRAARVLFLLLLIALPSSAAPTDDATQTPDAAAAKVVPSPTPRRYRLSDTEARHGGFLARVENCLPVALLIFLGFRGNVQVSGDVGNVRVSAGHDAGR